MPADDILKSLTTQSGFEYVAQKVDLVTARRVEKLDLAGIGILPDSRRVYPQDEDAGRLVGAVGTDGQGLFGIEAAENDVLGGTDGQVAITKDALGQEIGRDVVTGAEPGHDVQLTIDGRIQAYTEKVLNELGDKYSPTDATAIVMDPTDGDVLAMASWPPVNPNDLSDADPDQLGNMATGFTYEPGSTFKPFTIAGALQDGLVNPSTTLTVPGEIQVADRTIGESHPVGTRDLSVGDILAQSSNVGTVMIGEKLGDKDFGSLGRSLRLRQAHRNRLPERGAGHRALARRILRIVDRQPPDRSGALRHPDADDGGVRGDRQRRHPAHPAPARVDRRQARRTF